MMRRLHHGKWRATAIATGWLATTLVLQAAMGHGAATQRASKAAELEDEFSVREFYSIKQAVLEKGGTLEARVHRRAELELARERARAMARAVPRAAQFHGQDHFEARRDQTGRERWTHVGRPDELAYHLFFRAPLKTNGTFIETGAGDGVRASNTLFFEEQLGWTGLLVEGSTENFVALVKGGRRRKAKKAFAAVCERGGSAKFVGDGLAAGAVQDMTRRHVEGWGRHFRSLEVYDVPCERMDTLVTRAGLGRVVDLWSVDVEGGEWRALNSFDWGRVKVRVVVIEMGTSCFAGGSNRCERLLRDKGFCRVAKRAVNEFWTSDSAFKTAYCRP